MSNMKFKGLLAGAAVGAMFALSGGQASAATFNYDTPLAGQLDLGVGTIATLEVTDDGGSGVNFTLSNTGAAGSASWIDYLLFNYDGATALNDLVLTDDGSDAWTITLGSGGTDAGFAFDLEADVAPNGSANGLTSGNSTSWNIAVAEVEDFLFLDPNSLLHMGGIGDDGEESTKYTATDGGGGVTPAPIPLPAGLPLILTGLGLFGALRLRKRKTA